MTGEPPTWEWHGHFSVRVEWRGGSLFIDPFRLRPKRVGPVSLVLITNPRLGHLSPEDLDLVCSKETILAGPEDALTDHRGETMIFEPGDEREFRGLTIRAVSAYTQRTEFFPRERGWLGYVLEGHGSRLYHAGATDLIPEMDRIRVGVAFLPVSGRYVMGPEDAARAAEIVGAEVRVGLHLAGDRYVAVEGFVTRPGRGSPRS